MNKKSPYVRFAIKYCDKFGLFTINEITKQREYDECDIWNGILLKHDYETRNRGNNIKKEI